MDVRSGDLFAQHPEDVVIYAIDVPCAGTPTVLQAMPYGVAAELTAQVIDPQHLRVMKGRPGVLYRITWEALTFDIRVSRKGLFAATRDAAGAIVLVAQPIYRTTDAGERVFLGEQLLPTLTQTALAKGQVIRRRNGVVQAFPVDPTVPPQTLVRKVRR